LPPQIVAADAANESAPAQQAPAPNTGLGALAVNEAPVAQAPAPVKAAAHARTQFFQPPTPAVQIAVNIAQAAADGVRQIGIRLHPAELGRVEVKLEIARDGQVSAVVLADRADTLDALRNDAGALERALQDAGLNADQSGLKFGLREQNDGAGANGRQFAGNETASDDDVLPQTQLRAGRWTGSNRAVDISV
jgi:flagellar hook-length control protein FliK